MFTLVWGLLVWFDFSVALAFRGLMETTLGFPTHWSRMRSWFPPFANCAKDGAPSVLWVPAKSNARATRREHGWTVSREFVDDGVTPGLAYQEFLEHARGFECDACLAWGDAEPGAQSATAAAAEHLQSAAGPVAQVSALERRQRLVKEIDASLHAWERGNPYYRPVKGKHLVLVSKRPAQVPHTSAGFMFWA